uniref:Uncharacterized protein n=1 Tax=Strombidium rassoulzadegani TaxID=1082188 RepID=A0A7S3FT98_9SPIT
MGDSLLVAARTGEFDRLALPQQLGQPLEFAHFLLLYVVRELYLIFLGLTPSHLRSSSPLSTPGPWCHAQPPTRPHLLRQGTGEVDEVGGRHLVLDRGLNYHTLVLWLRDYGRQLPHELDGLRLGQVGKELVILLVVKVLNVGLVLVLDGLEVPAHLPLLKRGALRGSGVVGNLLVVLGPSRNGHLGGRVGPVVVD